jgi:hypothetical protein
MVPFRSHGSDAESTVRREMTIAAVPFQPDSFGVGIDEQCSTMLLHELAPSNRDKPI